jgi:cytochrome c-type biogenesis protein CcmH/NrfG
LTSVFFVWCDATTTYVIRKNTLNRASLALIAAAIVVVVVIAGGAAWYDGRSRVTASPTTAESADVAALEVRVQDLRGQVEVEPANAPAWRELGRAYMDLGRFLAAVEAWSVVAEMRPGDREAAGAFARLDDIARTSGSHKDQGR